MKKTTLLIAATLLLVVAGGCSTANPESASSPELVITDGTDEVFFSVADLEGLPNSEASFQGETYKGVQLTVLLNEAGFRPDSLSEVKAIAEDGFSATYTPDLFQLANTLVAFATTDGPMVGDDGVFRMVLPDQGGKLNVRQLIEIHVNP